MAQQQHLLIWYIHVQSHTINLTPYIIIASRKICLDHSKKFLQTYVHTWTHFQMTLSLFQNHSLTQESINHGSPYREVSKYVFFYSYQINLITNFIPVPFLSLVVCHQTAFRILAIHPATSWHNCLLTEWASISHSNRVE